MCAVCHRINWHSAAPLVDFCKHCGHPLVDAEEIEHIVQLPPAPFAPRHPRPPTGALASFGLGGEYRDYKKAQAHFEADQKRYEHELRNWREQAFAARERAVAESIWSDFHRRLPPDAVERMTGVEFESFLCQLFAKMGFSVRTTPASGDQGGDLILTGPTSNHRAVVQAKRSARPVSNRAVQEVLGAMAYYGCPAGIVVTNGEFTAGALSLAAREKRVEMWGGSKLAAVYAENFPASPLPFDRTSYEQLIERLRRNPERATAKSLHGRWQDQSPTEAQVALLWRKDADSKARFRNWRTLFAFATEQHRNGDQAWSRGGLGLRLDQCVRGSAVVPRRSTTEDSNKDVALGRLDQAHGVMDGHEQTATTDLGDARAWGAKGCTLRQSGRLEEALAAYEQALAMNPNESEYWREKGILLTILKRLEEAVAALNRALASSPNDQEAWWWKGMALVGDSPQRAFAAFERAAAISGQDFNIWAGLGCFLSGFGHPMRVPEAYQRALVACERALAVNPTDAGAWRIKGEVLSALGRNAEALEAYERVVAIDPEDLDAWSSKGEVLAELGRALEALAAYGHVAAVDPTTSYGWSLNAHAWFNQGVLFQSLGYPQEALNAYDRSLATGPNRATAWSNNAEAWFNKGVILEKLGLAQEALAAHEQALSINPDHAEALSRKTGLLQRMTCDVGH